MSQIERVELRDTLRSFGDQAFSRAAGAPLVGGNQVELLLDAEQNYGAWKSAIQAARKYVHFEMYILRGDVGAEFVELLVEKARAGVSVRVLHDWLGTLGTPRRLWRALVEAGAEVRAANPPSLIRPFSALSRNHRKLIIVDGEVAFPSGLCIGDEWLGDPTNGAAPWRDTGLEVRGPALADLQRAFAASWAQSGAPLPEAERSCSQESVGPTDLRVIATTPETTGLLRLDLLWAAIARRRLWLTDAYFVGSAAYNGALTSAAQAGVDVRLLVPSTSDIEVIARVSRAQYRWLLEAGVRVFEWNGPMVHAKTAVVDEQWSRVGSTNLNVASWMGNWELDVCVEDADFAQRMADTFMRDLDNATEIVLGETRGRGRKSPQRGRSRKVRRATAAALMIGGNLGVALRSRELTPLEVRSLVWFGLIAVGFGGLILIWPWLIGAPSGVALIMAGLGLLIRASRKSGAGPEDS